MMLHPATVHFAMVLPVVASVFGLVYMLKKDEGMSKLSSRLTLVAALAVIGVWYTGSQAGPEIYKYLSEAAKQQLLNHKTLGLYLAIAFGIIAILKIAGCRLKIFALEAFAVILLIGATAFVFIQGKEGGVLVYEYGTPFKSYIIENKLSKAVVDTEDADDDSEIVEIYEDTIDELNEHIEEIDTYYGVIKEQKDN